VREEGYGDIVETILCGEHCVEYTKGITQKVLDEGHWTEDAMQRVSSTERHREDIVQTALDGRCTDYITGMLGKVDCEADVAQRTLHGGPDRNDVA